LKQYYKDEIIEVWIQSLVAPKITVQSDFTSSLLNVDTVSPLLEDLPFVSLQVADKSKVISKLDFVANRLTILDGESFRVSFRHERASVDELIVGTIVVITNASKSMNSPTPTLKVLLFAIKQNLAVSLTFFF
jgi:hypothetical protein